MRVNGIWFKTKDIINACDEVSKNNGVKFPGSERPPFFYTGCPYDEAIIRLNVTPVEAPSVFNLEILPRPTRTPSQGNRYKRIAAIFGYDPELQYKHLINS